MPEEIEDLSHLHPDVVLGINTPNREELLKAAAEAPDTQLILPHLPEPARIELPEPPLAPSISGLIAPVQPAALEPLPVVEVVKSDVPPVPVASHIEIIQPRRLRQKPSKKLIKVASGIVALLVLVAALVALAYILALRGARLPVMYSFISKLQLTGLKQRDAALIAVRAEGKYQYLTGTNQHLSGSPQLSSNIQEGYQDTDKGTAYLRERLKGSNTEIPLLYRSGSQPIVRLALPTNSMNQQPPTYEFASSPLLLALQPIPLTRLLEAATSESGYLATTSNGLHSAQYTYTLDPSRLASLLPKGLTFQSAMVSIEYGWGSQLPRSSSFTATVAGTAKMRSYSAEAVYGGWGEVLPTSLAVLDQTNTEPITFSDFEAELGLHLVATPSPSIFKPLVPANASTTTLKPIVVASPPPPASMHSDAASARDSQRKADLTLLRTALIGYKTATGAYPVSGGLEQAQVSSALFKALLPTYLTAIPIDPVSNTFWYEYQSDGKSFTLRSVAEDPTDPTAMLGKSYHYFVSTN